MNTISGVRRALAYEIHRQIAALTKGEKVSQETRRWDDVAGKTFVMRTKEYAHDYRYFPEPDLMPVVISDEMLAEIRRQLPELPEARRQAVRATVRAAGIRRRRIGGGCRAGRLLRAGRRGIEESQGDIELGDDGAVGQTGRSRGWVLRRARLHPNSWRNWWRN